MPPKIKKEGAGMVGRMVGMGVGGGREAVTTGKVRQKEVVGRVERQRVLQVKEEGGKCVRLGGGWLDGPEHR